MRNRIVTFGEIMLRLAPYNYERFIQAHTLQATYGGGEANVAVSLARYGHNVSFVTRLPDNPIGDAAVMTLAGYGVNTEFILRGGERLGIYFLEHGASIRPSKVTYDRAGSAISQVRPEMFDWKTIFQDAKWFHITGITPALSADSAATSLDAVTSAKNAGLTVSCDLNYRRKLWSREQAKQVMTQIIQQVDVVIANEEDAADVFGIKAEKTDVTSGQLSAEHYRNVATGLKELADIANVAITLRESISASDNNWSAVLYDGNGYYVSRKYPIHLVDRVGGGDSFAAGLIHGLLQGWEKQDILEFAVAASALKQTIAGDMNLVNEDEVRAVMKGDISGRVQR